MKSKFMFVRKMDGFSIDDVVYFVWVGESKREQAKLALVQCYATDCALYFRKYDDVARTAFENLGNSLIKGCAFSTVYLRTASVSINELYSLILDDTFESFESNLTPSRSHFQLLSIFDLSFIPSQSPFHNRNTTCPLTRKYLKRKLKNELVLTAIKVGLILALFLTSGYLEYIERNAY